MGPLEPHAAVPTPLPFPKVQETLNTHPAIRVSGPGRGTPRSQECAFLSMLLQCVGIEACEREMKAYKSEIILFRTTQILKGLARQGLGLTRDLFSAHIFFLYSMMPF